MADNEILRYGSWGGMAATGMTWGELQATGWTWEELLVETLGPTERGVPLRADLSRAGVPGDAERDKVAWQEAFVRWMYWRKRRRQGTGQIQMREIMRRRGRRVRRR